ncbi:MAG: aminotransferase class V-fold PLP-dependent enzyme [Bacteroidota bacterium]|nr:aminotransferase class V-fold PLP-dependent enzyme [Bacteroidota bacterium]
MNNWELIRKEYPLVENFTYLNTPVLGAISKKTSEKAQKLVEELLHFGPYNYQYWIQAVHDVRNDAASLINASSNEIAFLSDVATGMNFISQMLPENNAEIILYEKDFPSVVLPWMNQNRKINLIPSECKGNITTELLEEIRTPESKILALSYVQYNKGFKIDIGKIGNWCKENDIIFIVDATQAIGAFEIDVEVHKIDFLVASLYKWTLGGYGTAILYINSEVFENNLPAVGWHSLVQNDGTNSLKNLKKTVSALEIGHPKIQNILMAGNAIKEILDINVVNIEQRIVKLTKQLHAQLKEKNVKILSDYNNKNLSGITIIEGTADTVEHLEQKNILCSLRGEGVRLGLHFYNNEQDINHLISVL